MAAVLPKLPMSRFMIFTRVAGCLRIASTSCWYWNVKDAEYFADRGVTNQHGSGGLLFDRDHAIMGWLFER